VFVSSRHVGRCGDLEPVAAADGPRRALDAGGLYHPVALVLGGGLCGSVSPKPLWPLYAGCVAGQVLYLLGWLPTGPLLPVGLVFVLLCSLVFLVGAYVGSRARTKWQARKQQPPRGGA